MDEVSEEVHDQVLRMVNNGSMEFEVVRELTESLGMSEEQAAEVNRRAVLSYRKILMRKSIWPMLLGIFICLVPVVFAVFTIAIGAGFLLWGLLVVGGCVFLKGLINFISSFIYSN